MEAVHLLTQNQRHNHLDYQLDELRIVNCKISSSTTEQLLRNLRERSQLSKLHLVNANVSGATLNVLCDLLKTQMSEQKE